MNEIQALNILSNLATRAIVGGHLTDINDAGSIYTALIVLSQSIPQQQVSEGELPQPKPESGKKGK